MVDPTIGGVGMVEWFTKSRGKRRRSRTLNLGWGGGGGGVCVRLGAFGGGGALGGGVGCRAPLTGERKRLKTWGRRGCGVGRDGEKRVKE